MISTLPATDPSRLTREAKLILGMSALLGFGTGLLYLFFNLYVLSLGYDQALVGLLASLPALITAAAAVPLGFLLPRLGFRPALFIGALLFSVSLFSWAAWPTRTVLIAASVTSGLGSVFLSVTSSPLLMAVTSESTRTRLFGLQFAANTFSSVLASLAGGYLARWLISAGRPASSGYRGILFLAAAITLATCIPIASLRGLGAPRGRTRVRVDWTSHRRALTRLFATQFVGALGAGMTMPFLNVFFRLRFGVPDDLLGSLFALSSFITGCAGLVAPWLAGRLGKVRSIVVSQAASIPLLIAMGLSPIFEASAGTFLVRTALMNMSSPIFAAYAMALVPSPVRPLAASLLMLAWNGGWAISAWISGHIQVRFGFTPLFFTTATLYACAALMTHVYFRHCAEIPEPVSPPPGGA